MSAVACVAPVENSYSLVLLDSASPELETLVRDAADDWQTRAPHLRFVVTREHKWERGREHTMWISEVDRLPNGKIGFTTPTEINEVFQVSIARTHGINPTTVRHEIGHGLRLQHDTCGVMYPDKIESEPKRVVQDCDVAQFVREWGT